MCVLTKSALLALVLVTGWSFGRQPAADKAKSENPGGATPTLEDLLNTALRNNPDVQVAEAKVREAEAELRRTRLNLAARLSAEHAKEFAARRLAVACHEE